MDATKSASNVGEAVGGAPSFAACFTADTKIKTKDGSKNISDIKVGDEVYSENPETGETGYQKVKEVFVTKTNTILIIKTQNETIETTKPHPFYVIGKGFVAAKDLQVGDHLKMANGEEAVIESLTLKHYKDPVTVYNFEVENWHTYHVSGSEVLVHNVAGNPCAGISNAGGSYSADYKYWKNSVEFDGNKVYQRDDLFDSNTISSWKEKGKTITGTNIERMASGRAPIGYDGKPINLHHVTQKQAGSIAEVSQTFHQKYYSTIHSNTGQLPSGINRTQFDSWKSNYWISRSLDFK